MEKPIEVVNQEQIVSKIYYIRGHKVMLDRDLAQLYCVETKQLTRQVRRNIDRFPEDFTFQLTKDEHAEILRCQFGTSSWGGRRYLPYAFTEHGILMLSSVLGSQKAIDINIAIMRTFTKIREMLTSNKFLRQKIEELEKRSWSQEDKISGLFQLMDQLLDQPKEAIKKIGFLNDECDG